MYERDLTTIHELLAISKERVAYCYKHHDCNKREIDQLISDMRQALIISYELRKIIMREQR